MEPKQITPDFSGRYLAYINGVRVPALSVTVNTALWGNTQAQISVAPHRFIARLGAEDRAHLAVFYLDTWIDGESSGDWCLLFEGEITGWSYSSTPRGRTMTFTARTYLSVLKDLYVNLMSGASTSYGKVARTDSDYPNQLKLKGRYPDQFFTVGLKGSGTLSRPFDMIENILFAVLGEHRDKQPNTSSQTPSDINEIDAKLRKKRAQLKRANYAISTVTRDLASANEAQEAEIQELLDEEIPTEAALAVAESSITADVIATANKDRASAIRRRNKLIREISALKSQRAKVSKDLKLKLKSEITILQSAIDTRKTKLIERNVKAQLAAKIASMDKTPTQSEKDTLKSDIQAEVSEKLEASQKNDATAEFKSLQKRGVIPDSTPIPTSVEDLMTAVLKEKARAKTAKRSFSNKSITQAGFFAQYMRLIRFREHWVASPYLEGRPRTKDPLSSKQGGGIFPILNAANARKVFRAVANQAGTKYGERGSTYSLIQGVFSALFYEVAEVLAPPALTVDSFGLPAGNFDMLKPSDESESIDPSLDVLGWATDRNYSGWASALVGEKKRLSIGSFITKPSMPFALPPCCNVIFPSMWQQYSFSEQYVGYPTRIYYNRKSYKGKLSLGSNLPGSAFSSTRVGYPAAVQRHMQDASHSGRSDLDILVFPEEYYAGPRPLIKDVHYMFTNIQATANSRRFSRGSEDPNVTVTINERDKKSPVQAANYAGSVAAIERSKKKGHSMHALYFLLAQKEFFEAKYSQRAVQVGGLFNPYIVCGFPGTVFDSHYRGVHCFGYVNQVSHNLSDSSFSTTVQMSHVRTYEEMFETLYQDGYGYDMAPMDPVAELRDLLQYVPHAHSYYAHLLYPNNINDMDDPDSTVAVDRLVSLPVGAGAFDYRTILGWLERGDPSPEDRNKDRILKMC